MSTESIKKLIQVENEAKEKLQTAQNKYEELKSSALNDAREHLVEEVAKNEAEIIKLEEEMNLILQNIEKNKKEEYEIKIQELEQRINKKKVVSDLIDKISGK